MSTPRKPQRPQQPIDPLLQQRLQQLGGRRAGAALPPPAPGTQQRVPGQQTNQQRQGQAQPNQQRQAQPQRTQQMPRTQPQPRVAAQQAAPNRASAQANARIAALAAARGTSSGPGKSSPTGKRAKPAAKAKFAALGLSAVTTLGLAAMFADNGGGSDSIQLTNGTLGGTVAPVTTAPVVAPASTVAGAPATTAATTVPAATGTIADGTYLGDSNSNRFGNVQVQVVYSGGQLVDVQIVQYPDGDRRSLRISQAALPTLISEALSTQNAQVDTVSGATYTSRSYKASLQSAIDNAKAASGISG